MSSHRSPSEVRASLKHPIIDGDGHWIEYGPVFAERMRKAIDGEIARRYRLFKDAGARDANEYESDRDERIHRRQKNRATYPGNNETEQWNGQQRYGPGHHPQIGHRRTPDHRADGLAQRPDNEISGPHEKEETEGCEDRGPFSRLDGGHDDIKPPAAR